MKHYKIKKFTNEAKKVDLSDESLLDTISDFLSLGKEGQQKYSLGAGLYKLRLATDKANVTTNELKKLKSLSDILLTLSNNEIARLIDLGELYEVIENV